MPFGSMLANTRDISLKKAGIICSFWLATVIGLGFYIDHNDRNKLRDEKSQRNQEDKKLIEDTMQYAENRVDVLLAFNPQLQESGLSRDF